MKLATLQRTFQAQMLSQSSSIDGEVAVDEAREEAAERLAIYANAYSARLTAALAHTYPCVQRALGAERFAAVTAQFSRDLPSRCRSVREFGEALPAYLAASLTGMEARGLQELAQWEWLLAAAFDAEDDAELAIDLNNIAPRRWAGLRFDFSASLRRMDVTTNALKWRGPTRPARWRALARPVSYAIWRTDLEVYFRALDAQEALALDAARQGATFGGVCERVLASARDDDFAASARRAAALLQNWTRARWIVRVHS